MMPDSTCHVLQICWMSIYPKSYATMYMMGSAKRAILYVDMRELYGLTGLMHHSRVETCTAS